jgi:hypothetical protein
MSEPGDRSDDHSDLDRKTCLLLSHRCTVWQRDARRQERTAGWIPAASTLGSSGAIAWASKGTPGRRIETFSSWLGWCEAGVDETTEKREAAYDRETRVLALTIDEREMLIRSLDARVARRASWRAPARARVAGARRARVAPVALSRGSPQGRLAHSCHAF